MTGRTNARDSGPRLLILLALIVALLVLLVVVKYWPPWVADLARETTDWLWNTGSRVWRQTGGRWVTLLAAVALVAIGLLVARRRRVVGVSLIEISIAAAALVALVQPDGW